MKRLIKTRNIRYLYHFTTVDNLISIIERGHIYSRSIIDELKITNDGYYTGDYVKHMDDERFDNLRDYLNLSLSRPHWYLLNKFKQKENLKEYDWCIIELNIDPIFEKFTLFSVSNAASKTAKCYGIKSGQQGLEALFADEIRTPTKTYNRKALPDQFTTDIQAEILVKDQISTEHFNKIYLANDEQLTRYKSAFKLLNLDNSLFKVNKQMFDKPFLK